MIRIIDERGSGKTKKLMQTAYDNHATFVCANPVAMEVKAKAYGFDGIDFISYHDFVTTYNENNYVIDEVEGLLKTVMGHNQLIGYTLTVGD